MYSIFYLEPVCCSMSSSNCCFLTCIQISQEADQVVWIPISFRIFHSLLWSTQYRSIIDFQCFRCTGRWFTYTNQFSSVPQSDSLWPHELQHARPPCQTPNPGAYPNSCPLTRWCHPTISSSVTPFSSCLQSFPASRSFLKCQLFHQVAKLLELQNQHQSF